VGLPGDDLPTSQRAGSDLPLDTDSLSRGRLMSTEHAHFAHRVSATPAYIGIYASPLDCSSTVPWRQHLDPHRSARSDPPTGFGNGGRRACTEV